MEENAVLRIHEDAFGGEIDDVRTFIDSTTDIDVMDKTGMTPFLFAVWGGHLETAKLLQAAGADIKHVAHTTGNNAMHLVASQTHFDMVKWVVDLMGEEELSGLNHLGRNPLHLACQAGSIESLEYMVERGGDLTAAASNGDTPLHASVIEGHIKMTSILIDLGADYDAPNKLGLTPLHLAVQSGHPHIVNDLLAIPEIEIHKNAKNGLSAVTMAQKYENSQPEIAAALTAAAALRPPPKPTRTPYVSRTMHRRSSRNIGSKVPGRGLVRAESKATIASKAALNKFDSMLSNAENEESRRLQALKDAEDARRIEAENNALRDAKEKELAMQRLEEEKKQRLEEKKRKIQATAEAQRAKEEAEEKLRKEKEAERLRKEAAERAIRQAQEERVAKEALEKAEAERVAAVEKRKQEEAKAKLVAEQEAKKEEEARKKAEEEAKQRAEEQARREREEVEQLAAIRQAEEERVARVKAEKMKEAEKEAERKMIEAEMLAMEKLEEEKLREEAEMKRKLDADMADKAKFETDKARAEAEKAIAEAEKAKAETEKAKAEAAKAKADAELSRKKAEILEHAARLRQEEADEARVRREQKRKKFEMQTSFVEQREELDAEVIRAERVAEEKKEALKAAKIQSDAESMRLQLEAEEAQRREEAVKKSHFDEIVDLTASTHAGLSLRRLNDRSRMSQRSIVAKQNYQRSHFHSFAKSQSEKNHVFGSFSSADPSERGSRHSIGSPGGSGSNRSLLAGPSRHSFGGEALSDRSRPWDRVRANVMHKGGRLNGSSRMEGILQDGNSGGAHGDGADERTSQGIVRKSVSLDIPSPTDSIHARSIFSGGSNGQTTPSQTTPSQTTPSQSTPTQTTPIKESRGLTSSQNGNVIPPFSPNGTFNIGLSFDSGSFSSVDSEKSDGKSEEDSALLTPASLLSEKSTPRTSKDIQLEVTTLTVDNSEHEVTKDIQLEVTTPNTGDNSEREVTPMKQRSVIDSLEDENDSVDEETGDVEGNVEEIVVELTPAMRLAAKKKAEAERVRAKRQAEAKSFEKRKTAAEAIADIDTKKLQAEELAKIKYLEAVIDSERAKVEASKSVNEEIHHDANGPNKRMSVEELEFAMKKEEKIETAELEKKRMMDLERKAAESKNLSVSSSMEENKSADQSTKSGPPRRQMAPRVKSLVLGDFSIRHMPTKKSSSNMFVDSSDKTDAEDSAVTTDSKKGNGDDTDLSKAALKLETRSNSSFESVRSDEDISLNKIVDVDESPHRHRFSSRSSDDRLSFEERKSIEKQKVKNSSKYGNSDGNSDKLSDRERQKKFEQGGQNNNSFVKRSLSSLNHVHQKSAARLGDLVIDETNQTVFDEVDDMSEFDDFFGSWIRRQAKLKPREKFPEDLLDAETSIDKYIVKTLQRSSELEWRLGQLEGKLPHPAGIHKIRKLLHAKVNTLKKLRDRNDGGVNLTPKQLEKLRNELHRVREECLEAVDRERVALNDPEHILQEELDSIANL